MRIMKKKANQPKMSKARLKRRIKDNMMLGALTLPGMLVMALFGYLPMFAIVLAFKNYKVPLGIFGSPTANPWYKNFQFFFKSNTAWRITRNTLGMNLLFIFVGLACSIVFALIMYEVKKAIHVKLYQALAILPSFLSYVAVGYIVYAMLKGDGGMLNQVIEGLGMEPINWYAEPKYWPVILTIVKLWHDVGLNSIVYYAALMGIDSALFEAAAIDGAGRIKQIIHISLPNLVPIATIMTILNIGQIFRADFGIFYNVTRNVGALYETTDVFDTYVYRMLVETNNVGVSAAATLIQSVVCFVTIMVVNYVVKKRNAEYALF